MIKVKPNLSSHAPCSTAVACGFTGLQALLGYLRHRARSGGVRSLGGETAHGFWLPRLQGRVKRCESMKLSDLSGPDFWSDIANVAGTYKNELCTDIS